MIDLTQEKVKELLYYNSDTGNFTRIKGRRINVEVGALNAAGYLRIYVAGKLYYSHRLAWLYMTGSWPENQIDHINQTKNDNMWSNLRECINSQNQGNRTKQSNNTSGYKGVSWNKHSKSWRAAIQGKLIGYFKCKDKAARAYNEKAKDIFGDFAGFNEILNQQVG